MIPAWLIDAAPIAIAGIKAGVGAIRDRRKTPAEQLAAKPRPLKAGLLAMLREVEARESADG